MAPLLQICFCFITKIRIMLLKHSIEHLDIWTMITLNKQVNFDFNIVIIFPFLDGDDPHTASYGVYISQLIHFTRASS